MIDTEAYQLHTLAPGIEPPQALVSLINSYFHDTIPDRAGWNYYFRTTAPVPPYIVWLEHMGRIIGHYALFYYDFTFRNTIIHTGKPELPCVSKEFIQYCIKNKINYARINPIERLNEALFEKANEQQLGLLFTWPNDLALHTYERHGYTIHPLNVQNFNSLLSPHMLYTLCAKKIKYSLAAQVIASCSYALIQFGLLLLRTVCMPHITPVLVRECASFSEIPLDTILQTAQDNTMFQPHRTIDILDKHFAHPRFKIFHISSGQKQGYMVININEQNHTAKVSDQVLPNPLFCKAFLAVQRTLKTNYHAESLQFRNYEGPAHKSTLALMYAGFLPFRTFIRQLAWKTQNKGLQFDKQKFQMSDLLSDYSIF